MHLFLSVVFPKQLTFFKEVLMKSKVKKKASKTGGLFNIGIVIINLE